MGQGYDEVMQRMAASREVSRQEYKAAYKVASHKRLRQSIETKMNTVMIGALDAFEKVFGHIWGQGKPMHARTPKELEMTELKDRLRTEILNNGNNQKRAAVAALDEYDVEWKRHHLDLPVRKD